jgi:hypothetical protein
MRSRLDTNALLTAVEEYLGAAEVKRAHWAGGGALTFEGIEVKPGELLALGADGETTWMSWTKDDAELVILELRGWKPDHARELLVAIAGRTFELSKGDVFVRIGHSKHWIGHEVVFRRHGVLA